MLRLSSTIYNRTKASNYPGIKLNGSVFGMTFFKLMVWFVHERNPIEGVAYRAVVRGRILEGGHTGSITGEGKLCIYIVPAVATEGGGG